MTGQDYYSLVSTLLHGFEMDTTLFYAYLNSARTNREMTRPFMRLKKLQNSQTVNNSNTYTNPFTIPTDFMMLSRESEMVLFDGNQTWEVMNEIPFELQIQYKDFSLKFFMDHASGKFYITGIVDKTYTIYIFYQADWGDITDTTTWINIPTRFHPILAYDVVAMYELGADYDDVSARNANSNVQQAELLFDAMKRWDDTLVRSSVTTLDYPVIGDVPTFITRKIDMGNGS